MQNKNNILAFIIIIIGIVSFLIIKNNGEANLQQEGIGKINQETVASDELKIKADKIEVVHFHGTQQCWSCITVGEYALKTIKEKFPEEYSNGKIVFKDIDGQLPENEEMVVKYQARGSSIFINAIADEKDHIEEDINVWRFVYNEDQFVNYFEDKLNKLLGK